MIVMRAGDEVGLQCVVRRTVLVFGSGRDRQIPQPTEHRRLSLCKEKLAEPVEVDTTRLHVDIAAGVKTPAKMKRRAFAFIVAQLYDRLAQRIQALESVDGGQINTGRFASGNAARSFNRARFQASIPQPGDKKTCGEKEAQAGGAGQHDPAREAGARAG